LLPLTYTFSWASLFVPDLLYALGTDESIRLLAELSMFRTPNFGQKCVNRLERLGPPVVPQIAQVFAENPAFDELKTGLIMVLGTIDTPESFALLARLTEHEDPDVVNWAAQALAKHQNPEALPYMEKAQSRLGKLSEIAEAIRELTGEPD
jgi:HEAT repeat protein